jgi:short-subunit dehydrogenase
MASEIQAGSATAAKLPKQLVSDPADVAAEGYKALMAGRVVLVPGLPNQLTAAWSQVTPRWLTRYVTGLAMRRTDLLQKP